MTERRCKHLRSCRNGGSDTFTIYSAATQECHTTDTLHDTPSRQGMLNTKGWYFIVLPIDVGRHT